MKPDRFEMRGLWDAHIHPIEDLAERVQTLEAVYADAAEAGMAGLVAKSHLGCTAEACSTVRSGNVSETHLLGSITLNEPGGGIDAETVDRSADRGAKVVWFPTYCAQRHIDVWGENKGKPVAKGLTVFDDRGRLSRETEQVLEVVRTRDLVLCSGHIAPQESLALFQRANALGVERMILTHASEEVTRADLEMQSTCASLGVFIEHCFMGATACCPGNISLEQFAREIRESGPERVVLSSDFGQIANGPIVDSFATYLARLSKLGFSDGEIRTMTAQNPGAVLL